jgi:AraC-like DNA-binding protein
VLSRSRARQEGRDLGFHFRREVQAAIELLEDASTGAESCSVAEVARRVGMSRDHFARVFRDATGWSPLEYFQMRRVHHACNLLLNPQNRITQIAHQLGYSDAAHFNRLFKRFRGMAPRVYRKTYLS